MSIIFHYRNENMENYYFEEKISFMKIWSIGNHFIYSEINI